MTELTRIPTSLYSYLWLAREFQLKPITLLAWVKQTNEVRFDLARNGTRARHPLYFTTLIFTSQSGFSMPGMENRY